MDRLELGVSDRCLGDTGQVANQGWLRSNQTG